MGSGALIELFKDQLTFYWDNHLRPRLDGLTDDEYAWEPVPDAWTVRRGDDGRHRADGPWPEPGTPPPFTTIAWRIAHVAVNFHTRVSTFFASNEDGADMSDPRHVPDLPADATGALAFLDDVYGRWHTAIAALDADELARPLGPRGAYFAAEPMAALIVHVNRETMHHGGEIGVLRDLYRAGWCRPGVTG
ncbi:DinB superfamily protein [Asanoa hainanensis]|uniref:DinB superfamily protein n=1 Tax=Asanoa hainanensis TaxID=560556 RepID=A0A239PC28_9ACTN|nr:DinB family protein [Asanoa hainanensis]SNT64214.1 DinB superfamily protein [Asanoa hainanensis]